MNQRRWFVSAVLISCSVSAGALVSQTKGVADALRRFERELARAEALVNQSKLSEGRAAARAAWAIAQEIPAASRTAEDVQGAFWRVGIAAYRSHDVRTAHDAWTVVREHRERTLPDNHPALQLARQNLATTKATLGDVKGALPLFQKVYEVRSTTLPDDHPSLQVTRATLAVMKKTSGDLRGALLLEQKVLEVFTKSLPDHDSRVQSARLNLGATKKELGQLKEARILFQGVLEVFSKTLPDDHPTLQTARQNLAATKSELGDVKGALPLFQQVFAVRVKTMPDDHPELQGARQNLAATKFRLGDLKGALPLQQKVLEVFSKTLPDDHAYLQAARQNLAQTKSMLGDLKGALSLQQEVLEVRSRTLPDNHTDLQATRLNLAGTRLGLGDAEGALPLARKAFEVWSRTLPDDHPDLQAARTNLANQRRALGDLKGALVLDQKVLAVCSKTLPDDHLNLQIARQNLASTKSLLGDLQGALVLQQKVFQVLSKVLPDDHPSRQRARSNLAYAHVRLTHVERAAGLARQLGAATRRRLGGWALAPRALGAMAQQERVTLGLILSLLRMRDDLAEARGLRADALMVSQTLRGLEIRSTRRAKRARMVDAHEAGQLEGDLRAAVARVSRITSVSVEGKGAQLEVNLRKRNARLAEAIGEKEKRQQQLIALAARGSHVEELALTVADLAARLPRDAAAAAIVGYWEFRPDPDQKGRDLLEECLAALVLQRNGTVGLRHLGTRADLESRVAKLRAQVSSGGELDSKLGKELRRVVLGPILSAVPDVKTIFLSVDEALELVPLDALPMDDGEPVGTTVSLRPLISLFDLVENPGQELGDRPSLLVLGGVDYARPGKRLIPAIGAAAAPPDDQPRDGGLGRFAPLRASTKEIIGIARLLRRAFAGSKFEMLTGDNASKAAFLRHARNQTIVHLATHGYFAPESVKSVYDQEPHSRATMLASLFKQSVTGLSPLVLTGLALSGANLPADELGGRPGILTAEEILSLDLAKCYLVTLSACNTSLGIRRAGQGYASLRAALQGAGARFVLTSLWKVGDTATMALMTDFYERLWRNKATPHAALWEAKMAARNRGAPFRDWAGWVLTGK